MLLAVILGIASTIAAQIVDDGVVGGARETDQRPGRGASGRQAQGAVVFADDKLVARVQTQPSAQCCGQHQPAATVEAGRPIDCHVGHRT